MNSNCRGTGNGSRAQFYVVTLAALSFLAAWSYVSVRGNFSADDAEPEILNQAWRLTTGADLYRGITTPPFVFAAYTPLYYALVAIFLKLGGLSYFPAKLISFFSAASIGLAIYKLDNNWNPSQRARWAYCFLFLTPPFLINSVRCHPQMMAVALSIWSFVFFLSDTWWKRFLLCPLLAGLAFYTKQTQIAEPLAMLAYLTLRDRRRLMPFIASLGLMMVVPFLILQKTTHGYFFLDVFTLAKLDFIARSIPFFFLDLIGPTLLFLGLGLYFTWKRVVRSEADPLDFYLLLALLVTLASLGRIGADGQYVVELLVVSLLCVVRSLASLTLPWRSWLVSAQVAFLILFVPWFIGHKEIPIDLAADAAAEKIYPLLQTVPGPILSRQGSFALFGSGSIPVQLFHFGALTRLGIWDQQPLLREIDDRTFVWFISKFSLEGSTMPSGDQERFSPELVETLRRDYRLAEVDYPYYVYRLR